MIAMPKFLMIFPMLMLVLSSVIGGVILYARQDPEYSCLSFDNITVQLDTSLLVRNRFPIYSGYQAIGDYKLIAEITTPRVRFEHPMNQYGSFDEEPANLILYSSTTGERIILEENIWSNEFYGELYWPEIERISYSYRSRQDDKTYFVVYDIEQHREITRQAVEESYPIVGYTEDGHYALIHQKIEGEIMLTAVNAVSGNLRLLSPSQLIYNYTFYPAFKDHSVAYFDGQKLHTYDLDTGDYQPYDLSTPKNSLFVEIRWLGDKDLLYFVTSDSAYQDYTQWLFRLNPDQTTEALYTFTYHEANYPQMMYLSPDTQKMYYAIWNEDAHTLSLGENYSLLRADLATGKREVISSHVERYYMVGDLSVFSTRDHNGTILETLDLVTGQRQEIMKSWDFLDYYWDTEYPYLVVTHYASASMSMVKQISIINKEGEVLNEVVIAPKSLHPYVVYNNEWVGIFYENDTLLEGTWVNLETGEIRSTIPIALPEDFMYLYSLGFYSEFQDWVIALYSQPRNGPDSTDLYRLDIESGEMILLGRLPANTAITNFNASPDGRYVALAAADYNNSYSNRFYLMTMRLEDSQWRDLGQFQGYASEILWSTCNLPL